MTTKQKIFLTAIDLFSTEGYMGASIRDITKVVGIKGSSFYKHYPSKEILINEIFNYLLKEYNKSDMTEEELIEKLQTVDLKLFLERAIEIFFYQRIERNFWPDQVSSHVLRLS